MVVTFTRTSGSSFYWTANITIYGIQASDYITHRVRIENINGALDYPFTLKFADPDTKHSPPSQFDASVVFAVGVTVGVIVGVTIIVAFILVRVFFKKRAQRSEAVSQDVVPDTDYEEVDDTHAESTTQKTPAMEDPASVDYIEIEDVEYERPVAFNYSRRIISNVLKSNVEYENTITPF
ncbi:hypothetical protein BsWGS_16900 [Bradybaena similaris]